VDALAATKAEPFRPHCPHKAHWPFETGRAPSVCLPQCTTENGARLTQRSICRWRCVCPRRGNRARNVIFSGRPVLTSGPSRSGMDRSFASPPKSAKRPPPWFPVSGAAKPMNVSGAVHWNAFTQASARAKGAPAWEPSRTGGNAKRSPSTDPDCSGHRPRRVSQVAIRSFAGGRLQPNPQLQVVSWRFRVNPQPAPTEDPAG
jgi:hypothetical protein